MKRWRISSKTGNKKERKSVSANDHPKQRECRSGLPHFLFVVVRQFSCYWNDDSRNYRLLKLVCLFVRVRTTWKQNRTFSFGFPIIAARCSRKGGFCFAYRKEDYFVCFSVFWRQFPTFTKPFVLLNALPHVFDQVGGLAVQKSTKSFDVLPRYAFSRTQLLDGGFTQNLLIADSVCSVALFLQSGDHIYFIL